VKDKAAQSDARPPERRADGMIDPVSLMRIKSMELRAKVVVEGFWKGIHRSPYHGFSVEFTEYRQYTSGDDPRYIDWQLYARSDKLYIKKFEDETNLRCHLLVDHSRSMGYGSGDYTKSQYAGTLAATLAYFLSTQGDAVGLATFDDRIRQHMAPRRRRQNGSGPAVAAHRRDAHQARADRIGFRSAYINRQVRIRPGLSVRRRS